MGRRRESPREEMSRRLRETREALGYPNATEYALRAGIGKNAYYNYENGFRIGLDAALKLCETYFLSLDWIYFGEPAALPTAIADKIRAHPTAAATPARKVRRRPFRKAS